jgi:uncharacterized protein (TIGR02598 family)
LIEVTLAIAMISFAFIALIGLLPAGLGIFNQTVDSTNEMRISTHLTSMLMASDFKKLKTGGDFSANYFYYDIDGGYLDSDQDPRPAYRNERIYLARALFDQQNVPKVAKAYYNENEVALRAIILIGKNNEAVKTYMSSLSGAENTHKSPPHPHKVRIFPVVISKNDGK